MRRGSVCGDADDCNGDLNSRCGLGCVRVHTLMSGMSRGGGRPGSGEVEVWFSTYQRLVLTSHPHPRPPAVCV